MAINKIAFDSTTLIDLSTDTVTSSNDIVSGKIGHLNDGSVVTGTASSSGSVVNGSIQPIEVNQGVISGSVSGDNLELPVGKFSSMTTVGNTLTASVDCNVGDTIICCFITRNCETPTLSSGWTLLSTSNINSNDSSKQRLNWATKIAESTTESITVTQTVSDQYLYINMLALSSAVTITDNGYTYFNSSAYTFTANKPAGLTIWGVSLPTRYQYISGWGTSNTQILIKPANSISTYQIILTSVDWSDDSSVTFTTNDTFSSTAIIGSLTITEI